MKKFAYLVLLIGIGFSCEKDESPCIYHQDVIDYYIETACRVEGTNLFLPIRKWSEDLMIKVFGNSTIGDINEINKVIGEVNLLQQEINLSLTETFFYNVEVHFIPRSKFDSILYDFPTASGIFTYTINQNNTIIHAIICIVSDENHLPTRNHAIREELTQILGLPTDSYTYPNSIFWQGGGYIPTEYSDVDKLLVQIHYSSVIKPGMTEDEIKELVCWR